VTSFVAADEPFVLVHGDFNGRNIMMQGSKVRAILDWEFSGAYPLSELVGGVGIDVLEVIDDDSEEENSKWSRRIMAMVGETARQYGGQSAQKILIVSRISFYSKLYL
jgi:Phosphotransferase enzyme family